MTARISSETYPATRVPRSEMSSRRTAAHASAPAANCAMIRGTQLHGVYNTPLARSSSVGGSAATTASISRVRARDTAAIRNISSISSAKSRYASHSALIDQAGPSQLVSSKNGANQSWTRKNCRR